MIRRVVAAALAAATLTLTAAPAALADEPAAPPTIDSCEELAEVQAYRIGMLERIYHEAAEDRDRWHTAHDALVVRLARKDATIARLRAKLRTR